MTPTTRAGLEDLFERWGVPYLLLHLDTFATVCPREPDDGQIEAASDNAQQRQDLGLRVDVGEIYRDMTAASPFAPERGDGNEQA